MLLLTACAFQGFVSTVAPRTADEYGALEYALWELVSENGQFMVQSNINSWLVCDETAGAISTPTTGCVPARLSARPTRPPSTGPLTSCPANATPPASVLRVQDMPVCASRRAADVPQRESCLLRVLFALRVPPHPRRACSRVTQARAVFSPRFAAGPAPTTQGGVVHQHQRRRGRLGFEVLRQGTHLHHVEHLRAVPFSDLALLLCVFH